MHEILARSMNIERTLKATKPRGSNTSTSNSGKAALGVISGAVLAWSLLLGLSPTTATISTPLAADARVSFSAVVPDTDTDAALLDTFGTTDSGAIVRSIEADVFGDPNLAG